MPQFLLQSDFKFGEVTRKLFSRTQSSIYYNAARKLRNVLVTPQGGAERRFGTEFVDDFTSNEPDYKNIRMTIFDYDDGSQYLLVFYSGNIKIYYDNSVVATVSTNYTASEIIDLDFAQSNTLFFIAQGNHPPAILKRTSAHAGWSIDTTPEFTHQPTFDFHKNYDDYSFNLYQTGTTTHITSGGNKLGAKLDVHSSTAMFNDDFIGGLFDGAAGTVRFDSRVDGSTMRGTIVRRFDNQSEAIADGTSIPGNLTVVRERAFSDTRGWPRKASFFQNRLFLANTDAIPGGLWGSVFNGFSDGQLNFDDSDTLATNAISTILYGDKAVLIKHLVSYRTLIVLTTNGLYSTSLLNDSPLSPTNINFINKQTGDSANDIDPHVLENSVVFFSKGGRRVKMLSVSDRTTKYETSTLSVLSPELVRTPFSSAVFQNSKTRDGSYLFMVNDESPIEGDLSIYETVPEQQISAWVRSTTQGKFRHVASSDDTAYFMVEREIDGSTKLFIEQLTFDRKTDSASHQAGLGGATTITGLSHLEGKTVKVIGDGGILPDAVVTSGQIELDTAVDEVEIGLSYTPEIEPLPLFIPMQKGGSVFRPKTISTLYVDFVNSLGITINGDLLQDYSLSSYTLGSAPKAYSDVVEYQPMVGWDPRQVITISQDDPLPFEITGIGFEVNA